MEIVKTYSIVVSSFLIANMTIILMAKHNKNCQKPVSHRLHPGTWQQFGKPASSWCSGDDHDDHDDDIDDDHDHDLGEVEVVLVDVDVDQLHHGVLQVSLVWPEKMMMMMMVPYGWCWMRCWRGKLLSIDVIDTGNGAERPPNQPCYKNSMCRAICSVMWSYVGSWV